MLNLASDYVEGAHPKILEKLLLTNLEQLTGYGSDVYCDAAKDKIRKAVGCEHADVFFLVGGTQTNQIVISSLLKPYEGVICADTGHIACHEAGAIEYTGHEVLELPQNDGKINPETLEKYLADFHADENHEHMTFPGMVYLSWPTEYGTLYSKAELQELARVCREYGIPLYLDGARLGYGLMSPAADLTLPDIASICDVFYIGGTKVGALCGEAVVISRIPKPPHVLNAVKKRGALLAKGRLLGIQFDTLFTDDLYFRLGKHGIDAAMRMKAILKAKGIPFFMETPTNQQFILLEDDRLRRLDRHVASCRWEKPDPEHTVVRLATSWATAEDDLNALETALNE